MNLVTIYNKGNVMRLIKYIQSEVEKHCQSYIFTPNTIENQSQLASDLQVLLHNTLDVELSIDGTRSVHLKF